MALTDRFEEITPVAGGAPGSVWRARRRDGGDLVAVTQLDREVAEQAPRVAVRLAQVDDPHLVRVLDVVQDDGRTLLVEQWVDAPTLDRVLGESCDISAQQAIATVVGVLDALALAHQHGVAHGDLRPEVVLIDPETGQARLLGFGLGRPIAGTTARGNPATIAPEVVQGAPANPRSDVYGAGCLLFWLLAGKAPFARDDPAEALQAHLRNPMPWLPGAPSDVRQIVRNAMAKDPAARYGSAGEMADELHAAASRRYGEGWDDGGALATRAAGLVAELGPRSARSQLAPETIGAELRPAGARSTAPSAVPLGATPMPEVETGTPVLQWGGEPVVRDVALDPQRRGGPVPLERAVTDERPRVWPTVLVVLLVLVALGAAVGIFYEQRHKGGAAGALPPTITPTSAAVEPTAGSTASDSTLPSGSPGPASDFSGRWTVTDTVSDVTGTIQGPDGAPLKAGDAQQRTYELTQQCHAPGSCTLTLVVQQTGTHLTLDGDGITYTGAVHATQSCAPGAEQALTATITLTVDTEQGGRVTTFRGTTEQDYTKTDACPAASSRSELSAVRS